MKMHPTFPLAKISQCLKKLTSANFPPSPANFPHPHKGGKGNESWPGGKFQERKLSQAMQKSLSGRQCFSPLATCLSADR